jgi:hypothetical protein
MNFMYSYQRLEELLRNALQPIAPRAEYVQALKKRLLFRHRMKVEMEAHHSMQDTLTIATVGLGAIATVAALTTLGVQLLQRTNTRHARQSIKDTNIPRGVASF